MFEEFEITIPIIVVMSSFKDISQGQYMRHDWSILQAEFHRTPRWIQKFVWIEILPLYLNANIWYITY